MRFQKGGFLTDMMGPMATSLIAPMFSSFTHPEASLLINPITAKGVMIPAKEQERGLIKGLKSIFRKGVMDKHF